MIPIKNIITLLSAVAAFGSATERELICYADLKKEQFDFCICVLESLGNVKRIGDEYFITSDGLVWLKHYGEFYKKESKELIELATKVMDFAQVNSSTPFNKMMLATVIPENDKLEAALKFLIDREWLYSDISKDEKTISHATNRAPIKTYWLNTNKR